MSRNTDSLRPAAMLGNALVLALLALAALALARLHSGPWWEAPPLAGRWAWAIGLCLAYLGICAAWLWRSRDAGAATQAQADPGIVVAWASQTGFAAALAERSAQALVQGGMPAIAIRLDRIDAGLLARTRRAVFIVSTTGEGDAPDHALHYLARTALPVGALAGLEYAVLALGDRSYSDFCAFGRQLDHWLAQHGAHPLFDRIEVDNADQASLRHWQYALERLGAGAQTDWAAPAYEGWTLDRRSLLNPGSQGGAVHELALLPPRPDRLQWLPGDIAEVGPCNDPIRVQALLQALGVDGQTAIEGDERGRTLAGLLARSQLPEAEALRPVPTEQWPQRLAPLPHREYSIASIPEEGALRLLVREMHDDQGRLGLGSGWLCRHAPLGQPIQLRIRSNPGFHPPASEAPLILVGNGTGIAGLRAHLHRRIQDGAGRNWLLFGERNRQHDFHYGQELVQWQAQGCLERLDLAFSRDPAGGGYVQDRLLAHAGALADWVAAGACILVCGNAKGMAPAVDEVLGQILGTRLRDQLREQGRYRRDVY